MTTILSQLWLLYYAVSCMGAIYGDGDDDVEEDDGKGCTTAYTYDLAPWTHFSDTVRDLAQENFIEKKNKSKNDEQGRKLTLDACNITARPSHIVVIASDHYRRNN